MADISRDLIKAVDLLQVEVQREIHLSRATPGLSKPHLVKQASESSERAVQRCLKAAEEIQRLNEMMPSLQLTEKGEVALALRRLDSLVARRKELSGAPRICGHN
jgi:hypothetical protein